MTEKALQPLILRTLGSRPDVRLFRNQVGGAWTGQARKLADGSVHIVNPRFVSYGLATGSADLIGWQSITIAGRTLAVFTSIEVKGDGGRATEEQERWRAVVRAHGGNAAIARSVEEATGCLL